MSPKNRSVRPLGGSTRSSAGRVEDGMWDPHELRALDAEVGEALDRLPGVHDHARSERQRLAPCVERALPAREGVVRGDDERPRTGGPAEPPDVELGPREPLDVNDVGIERVEPPDEPPDARQVLGPLDEPA